MEAVVQTIDIQASPEQVFAVWTDPQQLLAWWGDDETYQTTHRECDLRIGGKWRSRGKSKDGTTFSVEGEYLRVDPPSHLSFTWSYDWGPGESPTVVELEFAPIP